jgi:hypothetical protein
MSPGAGEFGPKAWAAHGPLRCHATETGSARGWTQANADAAFIAAAPGDIGALIAEVELLRTGRDVTRCYADRVEAEVLALRAEARLLQRERDEARAEVERLRGHRESCTENLLKGYETGKAEERAAVVAWLRGQRIYGTDELLGQGFANVCGILSDAIERGEHRREETK